MEQVADKKVSIITISFNAENTIKRTIESVLNQTDTNYEYIIIDGNSQDNTMNIVKEYDRLFQKKNISFNYISELDEGISDAFNKGIDLSEGELIGILNADDYYCLNAIQIIRSMYSDSYQIYCGAMNLCSPNGECVKKMKSKPLFIRFGMYIRHPTVFVKKEVYKELRFSLDFKIAMDFDLILRALNKGYRIKKTKKVITSMSLGGVSGDLEKMKIEEREAARRNNNLMWYFFFLLKEKVERIILKLV